MKYLIKNQTSKTIWKKCFVTGAISSSQKIKNSYISAQTVKISSQYPTKKYGVKLATWSRKFDFTPFQIIKNKEPCPNDI